MRRALLRRRAARRLRGGYDAAPARLKRGAAAALVALFTFAPALSVAEPLRLAALGDSLTQGYGLEQGMGFVPQLEKWLRARGHDVTVINAGVSGDTTAGGLARLAWTLADEPDAVIVALGANDVLRGIDPAESRANLDAILERLAARGVPALLVGLPAPGNYGPDYKRRFDAIFPELARKRGAILHPDFFAGLGAGGDPAAARALVQADGVHPNAAGVRRIVADIGPAVERLLARAAAKAQAQGD